MLVCRLTFSTAMTQTQTDIQAPRRRWASRVDEGAGSDAEKLVMEINEAHLRHSGQPRLCPVHRRISYKHLIFVRQLFGLAWAVQKKEEDHGQIQEERAQPVPFSSQGEPLSLYPSHQGKQRRHWAILTQLSLLTCCFYT